MASSRESSSFTVVWVSVSRVVQLRWGAAKRIVLAFIELVGMTDAGEAVSNNENALTC